MEFLFVCVPDTGHLHPLTVVAAQLQSNTSSRVTVASLEDARAKVEAEGIQFLSLGAHTEEEAIQKQRVSRAVFDANAPFKEKITAAARSQIKLAGYRMSVGLFQYLEHAQSKGTLPDVLVTDNWTLAGYEAAEKFKLPLAVLAQYPVGQSLIMAGLNKYNMPCHIPAESMLINTSEHAGPLLRYVIAPLVKALYNKVVSMVLDGPRNELRAKLGLPPMDASSGGHLSVQPGVPRSLFLCGTSWELSHERLLPDNWHLVGPLGVDYSVPGSFPPPLGPKDKVVQQFLEDAQAAGEAVVYVATGTMVVLTQQQINAMAQAFQQLANQQSAKPVRFLWSLKEDTQKVLPESLQSNGGTNRVLVLPWVNQAAVLAHPAVKAFISHGGLGSTNEGLSAGKPIICMPFSGDQPTIAQQLVDRRVGTKVNPAGLKPSQLLQAVQQVLLNSQYAEVAAAMGNRLRAESGPKKAAELLLHFAAAGGETVAAAAADVAAVL